MAEARSRGIPWGIGVWDKHVALKGTLMSLERGFKANVCEFGSQGPFVPKSGDNDQRFSIRTGIYLHRFPLACVEQSMHAIAA